MLWKYKKCYQEDSKDIIIVPPPSTDLCIISSVPELGTGVIDIIGGEPYENINLYNEFLDSESLSVFNTIPLEACGPPLGLIHGYSAGTVTLGASGNLTYTYTITNITIVKITITGRSSAEPLPTTPNNSTTINNNS